MIVQFGGVDVRERDACPSLSLLDIAIAWGAVMTPLALAVFGAWRLL